MTKPEPPETPYVRYRHEHDTLMSLTPKLIAAAPVPTITAFFATIGTTNATILMAGVLLSSIMLFASMICLAFGKTRIYRQSLDRDFNVKREQQL